MARSANPFTFQGFDATTELLRGPVRPKKNPYGESQGKRGNTSGGSGGDLTGFLQRVGRVTRKAPEVMVRITGGAKGKDHISEHLSYITRNGKLEATNDRGETIHGRVEVRDLAKEWAVGISKGTGRGAMDPARRAPDTRNLVLSMPVGTDPQKILRAAKTFADKTFGGERAYVLALHTHDTDPNHTTKQPHVHLTLKTRGYDGRNLNPRKPDLQAWREGFAHELRELGVEAEATPRRARGVVRKGKGGAVFHMEQDVQAGKKQRASKVQRRKYEEAVSEITGHTAPKERPWEAKTAERQQKIRGGWLAVAKVLDKHPAPEARALAGQVRNFVAGMPPVMTERQAIERQVRSSLDRGRGGPDRA